jgi:hypothetical protein
MKMPARHIGLVIGTISGAISSTLMTFIGVAVNYGFRSGFIAVWLKAALIGYGVGVPLLMLIVPRVQRFVMRHAAV